MNKLVEMVDVGKSYDGKRKVLEHLNFSISEGEIATIYGSSGCGKSTFLNIVGLLDSWSEGDYFFNGRKILTRECSRHEKIRANDIGFIFQSYCLIDSISVLENIMMPLMYTNNGSSQFCRNHINEILGDLDILHLIEKKANTLSGGERQRVAIARAIIKKPKLIIADEPTGNLDEDNAYLVAAAFKRIINLGTSIIVVTHNRYLDFGEGRKYLLHQGALKNV